MGLGLEYGASVWSAPLGGAEALLLEFNMYFDRPGIYNYNGADYSDNGGRFAFMCRAALDWCLQNGWIPDVVHCHDWTAGLAPVLLNTSLRNSPLGGARASSPYTTSSTRGYSTKAFSNTPECRCRSSGRTRARPTGRST